MWLPGPRGGPPHSAPQGPEATGASAEAGVGRNDGRPSSQDLGGLLAMSSRGSAWRWFKSWRYGSVMITHSQNHRAVVYRESVAMHGFREWPNAGGLMADGTNLCHRL